MKNEDIQVFDFIDYRAFLRALYEHKKAQRGTFSFRAFSRRAGISSPNYLKLVMDGERNLTSEMAERFATTLGLEKESLEYFVDLVAFDQAKTPRERDACYKRLARYRRYREAHRLETAHAAYFGTWYLPALRELASREDFQPCPRWISRTLMPAISEREAEEALITLLELGLLVKQEDGSVILGEAILSTGARTKGLHIRNYHREMMRRASETLDELQGAERDISSLTLCLDDDAMEELKDRVASFRRELLDLSTQAKKPRRVFQVNMQVFPLSKATNRPLSKATDRPLSKATDRPLSKATDPKGK